MSTLSLTSLLDFEIDRIASTTNDRYMFRIYLGDGRFQAETLPIELRNDLPGWYEAAPEPKAYLDQFVISEYMWAKNPDAITRFLGTVAVTFGVPEDKQMALTEQFYAAVKRSHADTIDLETIFRGEHEIH